MHFEAMLCHYSGEEIILLLVYQVSPRGTVETFKVFKSVVEMTAVLICTFFSIKMICIVSNTKCAVSIRPFTMERTSVTLRLGYYQDKCVKS